MKKHTGICCLVYIIFLCGVACAESIGAEEWDFQLATYAWLSGQQGTVATLPGLPPLDIDVDFYDDIVGNSNGALNLIGEARKGKFGLFFRHRYSDIEDDDATPGPFFSSLEVRTKTWIVSAAGFYRLIQQDRAFLDGMAGVRYQWTQGVSTTVGYRYLDVDYEKDEFLYDVSQDGPVLGRSWRF